MKKCDIHLHKYFTNVVAQNTYSNNSRQLIFYPHFLFLMDPVFNFSEIVIQYTKSKNYMIYILYIYHLTLSIIMDDSANHEFITFSFVGILLPILLILVFLKELISVIFMQMEHPRFNYLNYQINGVYLSYFYMRFNYL